MNSVTCPRTSYFKPAVSALKTNFSLEIHQAIMDYRVKKEMNSSSFVYLFQWFFFPWPSNLCYRIGSLSYSDLQIACYCLVWWYLGRNCERHWWGERPGMKTLVYLSHYPSFLLFYLLIRQISFFVDVCLCDGEGSGTPLHYSCLENPMDRGAW